MYIYIYIYIYILVCIIASETGLIMIVVHSVYSTWCIILADKCSHFYFPRISSLSCFE